MTKSHELPLHTIEHIGIFINPITRAKVICAVYNGVRYMTDPQLGSMGQHPLDHFFTLEDVAYSDRDRASSIIDKICNYHLPTNPDTFDDNPDISVCRLMDNKALAYTPDDWALGTSLLTIVSYRGKITKLDWGRKQGDEMMVFNTEEEGLIYCLPSVAQKISKYLSQSDEDSALEQASIIDNAFDQESTKLNRYENT